MKEFLYCNSTNQSAENLRGGRTPHRLDSTRLEQRSNKAKAGAKMKKGDTELQALSIQSTYKWPPIKKTKQKWPYLSIPAPTIAEK